MRYGAITILFYTGIKYRPMRPKYPLSKCRTCTPTENQPLIFFFVAFASRGILAIFGYYLSVVAFGILNNLNNSAGLDTQS